MFSFHSCSKTNFLFFNITGLNINPSFLFQRESGIGTLCSFSWQINVSWSYVVLPKKCSVFFIWENPVTMTYVYLPKKFSFWLHLTQRYVVLPEKNGCWVQISHEIRYTILDTEWFGNLRLSKMKRAPSIYPEMVLTQKVKILSYVGLPWKGRRIR